MGAENFMLNELIRSADTTEKNQIAEITGVEQAPENVDALPDFNKRDCVCIF